MNPTGSFKDRGMTMAMTAAVESGAKAVVCASTGNTSASAAAYATAAGLKCAVLVPEGKISMGKLSQAIAHGATLLQVDGNFDNCLDIARKLGESYPVFLVNSVNPARIQGQKTGAFEIVDSLGDAPDIHVLPVGNAGNITAYWKGYKEYSAPFESATAGTLPAVSTKTPQMWGFQAAGAAPFVAGHPITEPDTIATAIRIGNPASWDGAIAARDESGGFIDAVTDERDPGTPTAGCPPGRRLRRARLRRRRRGPAQEARRRRGPVRQDHRHHRHRPRPQGPPVGPADRRRQRRAAGQGLQRRRHRCRRTGTGRQIALETTLAAPLPSCRHRRPDSGSPSGSRPPAPTSGPGYDSLGLALALHDTLTVESLDSGELLFELSGEGAETLPRDASHLVVRAMEAAFERLGYRHGGLKITADKRQSARPRPGFLGVGRGGRRYRSQCHGARERAARAGTGSCS